jgi:hypothetical protein
LIEHAFVLLGEQTPALLGRKKLLARIERGLLGTDPPHMQITGPRFYGKSVLLSHIAKEHQVSSARYMTSAYVDLRHETPTSDQDFRLLIARAIKSALHRCNSGLYEQIDLQDGELFELVSLTLDDLSSQEQCILLVLDGFDYVMRNGRVTRAFWNQLRSLSQKRSLRLLTGSRRPLRELCDSEESRTSDFWEVFEPNPIHLGPFSSEDWDSLLEPFIAAGIDVQDSARKELINWTGGIPVLAIGLLKKLASVGPGMAKLDKDRVDECASSFFQEGQQILSALWNDCTAEQRGDLEEISTAGPEGHQRSKFPEVRRNSLISRGYALESKGNIRCASAFMSRFALQQEPSLVDLRRLLGSADGFQKHGQSLLEIRLSQLPDARLDTALRNYLRSAIRELGEGPEGSLKWARGISSRVMRLIWDAELPADEGIPEEWLDQWKLAGEKPTWMDIDRRIPRDPGLQVAALRLATGNKRVRRVTSVVTKPTCLLVEALHSIGGFAQHRDEYPESEVTATFALSVVLMGIELASSWLQDCGRTKH